MRILASLSLALLMQIAGPAPAQNRMWLVDPLEPVYPDSNTLEKYGTRYEADFPKGTCADVHLLLRAAPGDSFTVGAELGGASLPPGYWSRLIDVPVEQNTGLDSRTEAFTGAHNPYVIRRAPFRIFEAIQPLTSPSLAARGTFTALRLSIPPQDFPREGTYTIRVIVHGGRWTSRGTFAARIHAVRVPPPGEGAFFYTNWFSLAQMEEKEHLVRWTPAWFDMLNTYAALMAHGRQNCIIVPGELLSAADNRIALDEDRLAAFIAVFRSHGFRYFESPHLMYRGESDDWNDPVLKVALTKHRYDTPEGKADVDSIVSLLHAFTKRHGLTHSWLQHIADEPTAVQARCYREVVRQVRSVFPDIRIIDAVSDRDTLAGSVDIWCPTIDDFQNNQDFFRARQSLGEEVLVYTCLVPGGPWLNRLLDQERLRQVYFGWAAAAYNTGGFLHWGLNQYQTPDPLSRSVVHHPSPAAAPNNFLPAGDSHIIYPGPLSSTRFEAHRVGIEDYELLRMLKRRDEGKAAGLIRRLFRTYTDYSTDISLYRETRRELLQSLTP